MTMIIKRGSLPSTPHTEYYHKDGVLSLEEIHGSFGFSGAWTRKNHVRSYPTEQVSQPKKASFNMIPKEPKEAEVLQPYMIHTIDIPIEGDAITGRKPIVFGSSTVASISKPENSMGENVFFRNGEKHEIYFVQDGSGIFHTEFGDIEIKKNHYICIPKGTTYNIELKSDNAWFLIMESNYPIVIPPHYINDAGQATLMSPIVETEIIPPELPAPIDERGKYPILMKHNNGRMTEITLGHHPFDVAGWEGALYPFAFDIFKHHGIAREIHTAPPMHQTFSTGNVPHNGFSLCSFVPQMEGWHPKDVPAPYGHYNVDSDECMFFCNASYGARKGVIKDGSFTFHPGALAHSPQGKAALRSLAARGTMSKRLAVMFDTYFEPLKITEIGWKYRQTDYAQAWDESRWEDQSPELVKAESFESPSE